MRRFTLLSFIKCLWIFSLLISCSKMDIEENKTDYFYTTDFFKEVQLKDVFKDSKTFVDCIPQKPIEEILKIYESVKEKPGFDLKTFVTENFELPERKRALYTSDTSLTIEEHISLLWPFLTRETHEIGKKEPSILALPKPYVVPGGRFSEMYYWDSYFTMIGLRLSGKEEMSAAMLENFTYLIDSFGFIPNGNRTYYKSRSQPPFYSYMVELEHGDADQKLKKYLPFLLKEYNFWMKGEDQARSEKSAVARVVSIDEKVVLNRYWDSDDHPRPESYREDYVIAHAISDDEIERKKIYRHIRAACESGWDFSSRWLEDPNDLHSIHTCDIIPVDLNCLIYHLETLISKIYKIQKDDNNSLLFQKKAENRKAAILLYCWNSDLSFFTDYDFVKNKQKDVISLAATYPLFERIATDAQAKLIKDKLESEFLKEGGLLTTISISGQQWDAPNGWAPLQWISVQGLNNYGYSVLAYEVAMRWIFLNTKVYKNTGSMMEKYNVEDVHLAGGGGEYPLQDGFGWTNGVLLELKSMIEEINIKI